VIPPEWSKGWAFALVRRGVIIRQRTDVRGRAVSVDAAGPGAFLPLGELGSARGSVATGYAASDVLLCVYPDLNEEPRHECLSRPTTLELFKLQTEALQRVDRIADARSRTSVERRVGALLCALADTLSPPARETIPALPQRDLAALIETRHESVCRVLRKFERQGWIARTPEHIAIVNRAALEEQ
jgi:CRP-like cAMP-binding protein